MSTPDVPWFQAHPVHHDNIVWHWERATTDEIRRGMRWYTDARHVATAIAHGDTHLGAGMLAVYSPQQPWIANVLLAARVLQTGVALGGPGGGVFASTAQKLAAIRLLAGHRWDTVLSGPKVCSFARLIEHGGDTDPAAPSVVIDRHALSVACGHPVSVADFHAAPLRQNRRRDGRVSHRQYDRLVELYHQAAATISRHHQQTSAHQVQAITWLVRQRLNDTDMRARGLSLLDKARETTRRNTDHAWHTFRTTHLPDVRDWPSTGYPTAAQISTNRAAPRHPRIRAPGSLAERRSDEHFRRTIDAVATSINITDREEATRLVHTVAPLYRHGQLTWAALIAACRLLYHGFDRYQDNTKAHLLREARAILRLGENATTFRTAFGDPTPARAA